MRLHSWRVSVSRFQVEVEAELRGYNKTYVWIKIPGYGDVHHPVILTMPRDFLPHGMATAKRVVLAYEPESFGHDGHGYAVNGEIVRMLDGETET